MDQLFYNIDGGKRRTSKPALKFARESNCLHYYSVYHWTVEHATYAEFDCTALLAML